MPTDQPSSAPDNAVTNPRDDATAAAVLHDDALDTRPGGGGLGGRATAGEIQAGGNAPNAPIDVGVAAGEGTAEREAQARSLAEDAPEPRPSSR